MTRRVVLVAEAEQQLENIGLAVLRSKTQKHRLAIQFDLPRCLKDNHNFRSCPRFSLLPKTKLGILVSIPFDHVGEVLGEVRSGDFVAIKWLTL